MSKDDELAPDWARHSPSLGDNCPECGAKIIGGDNWSGVKCSDCPWWFCY